MFFRRVLVLRDVDLKPGQVLTFDSPDTVVLHLELRKPPPEEQELPRGNDCICTVTVEESVSDKVTAHVYADLAAENEWRKTPLDNRMRGKMPQRHPAVADLSKRIAIRTGEFARRIANLIRWRTGQAGDHRAIKSSRSFEWSVDGEKWERMPGDVHVTSYGGISTLQIDQTIDSINQLVRTGEEQPLAHELLREAWDNFQDHRSALMMGIAAAEIGFKQLVARLVPNAEWLAMHAPTPPLVAMLQEYLPALPVRCRFGELPPFVPKPLIEIIKKGVKLRNEVTHAGKTLTIETLDEIIRAVRDLLYLCDFYSGQQWAQQHLSWEAMKPIREALEAKK